MMTRVPEDAPERQIKEEYLKKFVLLNGYERSLDIRHDLLHAGLFR